MTPRTGRDDDREVSFEDERSADDRDEGWGERPELADPQRADDARFLDDVPPHW